MGIFSRTVIVWWSERGKILCFKLLILVLFLSTAAREYAPFQKYIPDERYLLLIVGPILLLMLEILIDRVGRDDINDLILPESALQDLRVKVMKGKTLDIAASSTESIYLALRDSLVTGAKIHCRIILRNPIRDDISQSDKLQRYARLWMDLMQDNSNLYVEIRFTSNNISSRYLIYDRKEAYVGFYKWDGTRYWGHNVPMVHAKTDSKLGNYLLDMAMNTFESTWAQADAKQSFRNK